MKAKQLYTLLTALYVTITAAIAQVTESPYQSKLFTDGTIAALTAPSNGIGSIKSESVFYASPSAAGVAERRDDALSSGDTGQIWWNYYDVAGAWYIYGTSKAESYSIATFVPYGYLDGDGCSIDGLALYFLDSDVTDIKYWVSTTLPGVGMEADLETVQLPTGSVNFSDFNEVRFNQSHIIPEGGLYVGYSFTISEMSREYSTHPVSYRKSEMPLTSGFFIRTSSDTSWKKRDGDLMVRILSGGQFKENAVNVYADDHIYTIKGTEQTIDVGLKNMGTSPVNSVGYIIQTDGRQVASGTCTTFIKDFMSKATISISVPTDVEAAVYDRTIIITDVNGKPNEADGSKTSIKQYNLLEKAQFMPLFEEFTGTWCGWCVRGIVAMNRAYEQYGDKAALIAVHNDNAMGTDDYTPIISAFCNGYPTGVANRAEPTSIGTNTVVDFIKNTIDNVVPAAIVAEAHWTDEGKTAIKIDTKTTFQVRMTGNYAIAYVLIADGLTGTGSLWAQSNYYSGESDSDPDLQYWCLQPETVTGLAFDHVAVAAWQPLYGVEGSVKKDIQAGVPQDYSFTADINGNSIIQDKSKLKVIAMLLDADTGEYINATQTTISDSDPYARPKGDVNGDGAVDVADIASVIDCMAGSTSVEKTVADVNGDGTVDVADIATIIDKMAASARR